MKRIEKGEKIYREFNKLKRIGKDNLWKMMFCWNKFTVF